MKRAIQLLTIAFATWLLMSFLAPRPKLAMEGKGNVADWLPDDTSPVIDYPARGFEVIHGRDEIKADLVKHFAKQGAEPLPHSSRNRSAAEPPTAKECSCAIGI